MEEAFIRIRVEAKVWSDHYQKRALIERYLTIGLAMIQIASNFHNFKYIDSIIQIPFQSMSILKTESQMNFHQLIHLITGQMII